MSRIALAAALAICASSAQAWETVVRDSQGLRTVELRGLAEGSESSGIALVCYPDSGDAAFIFARDAVRDYARRPGDMVAITIGDLKLPAEVLTNDSNDTSAVAQGIVAAEILAVMGETSGVLTAGLVEMRSAALTIGGERWEESSAEFTTACGL